MIKRVLEQFISGNKSFTEHISSSLAQDNALRIDIEQIYSTGVAAYGGIELANQNQHHILEVANTKWRNSDPYSYICFLNAWIFHCLAFNSYNQLEHVFQTTLKVLDSVHLNNKILLIRYLNSLTSETSEIQPGLVQSLEQSLKQQPAGSYVHLSYTGRLLGRLFMNEDYENLSQLLNQIDSLNRDFVLFKSYKATAKLYSHLMSLRLHKKTETILTKREMQNLQMVKPDRGFFQWHHTFRHAHDPKFKSQFVDDGFIMRERLDIISNLKFSDPQRALSKLIFDVHREFPIQLGYFASVLLGCQRVNSATRVIRRIEELSPNYISLNWLKCRASLLNGRSEPALKEFKRYREIITELGSRWRFHEDLDTAPEISFSVVADLYDNIKTISISANTPMIFDESRTPAKQSMAKSQSLPQWKAKALTLMKSNTNNERPLLITGDTGSGKRELIKELAIYGNDLEIVEIDCAGLNPSLFDSMLMGHVKGAFTGSTTDHIGFVESTGSGILHLRGLESLAITEQMKLLNLIEKRRFRKVGSTSENPVHCTFIFSTTIDIDQQLTSNKIVEALYHALSPFRIDIPRLEKRSSEIIGLAQEILAHFRPGATRIELSKDLQNELIAKAWPGNIRQLKNQLQLMVDLNADTNFYTLKDWFNNQGGNAAMTRKFSQQERLEAIEKMSKEQSKITRIELARALNVSTVTMTQDLKLLQNKGVIRKIKPTPSPRSHYFIAN